MPNDEDAPVDARLRRGLDRELGGHEFYAVAQLRLGENRDPILRDIPSRSGRDVRFGWPTWTTAADEEQTNEEDRARLRSWRALYRRAARSLSNRELIETADCEVFQYNLDGATQPPRWASAATLEVLLARITDTGRRYVEERRTELVAEDATTDSLRQALRAAGFLDIAAPQPSPRRRPKRVRRPQADHRLNRRKTPAAEPAEPRKPRLISRDDVVVQLESEGHTPERVGAILRAWHRDEQREARALFGDNGVPLYQRLFAPDDIAELKRRLTDE